MFSAVVAISHSLSLRNACGGAVAPNRAPLSAERRPRSLRCWSVAGGRSPATVAPLDSLCGWLQNCAARGRRLVALREALRAGDVDADVGLIALDPGVVARWDLECVARADVQLGAVVHDDVHPARDAVAEMMRLATVGAGKRLHRLRPFPAGLERRAHDAARFEIDDLDGPIIDGSRVVRWVERLSLCSHVIPFVGVGPSYARAVPRHK